MWWTVTLQFVAAVASSVAVKAAVDTSAANAAVASLVADEAAEDSKPMLLQVQQL
jgi:hypothetical protein